MDETVVQLGERTVWAVYLGFEDQEAGDSGGELSVSWGLRDEER